MAKKKRKVQLKNKTQPQNHQKQQPQIIFYSGGVSDGCSIFRMEMPRKALNESNQAICQISNHIFPLVLPNGKGGALLNPVYKNTHCVVKQRPTNPNELEFCKTFKQVQQQIKGSGQLSRFVMDVDDILHGDHVSKYNTNGKHFFDNKRFNTFAECVKQSDELHVCSKAMRDFYREEIGFEQVLYKPNFLPKYYYDWFDLERSKKVYEKNQKKPRILYAGAAQHFDKLNQNGGKDDFTHILDLIHKTKHDWQWVFYGAHPNQLQSDVNSGLIEFHQYTPFSDYPKKLMSLEPTVMLAPLENNTFNKCKSNIKLTEAGALGIAGVYQNLDPYEEAPLKFDSADEMADQINFLLESWENYEKVILEQRQFAEQFFIEDNINFLLGSYLTEWESTKRNVVCPKIREIQ